MDGGRWEQIITHFQACARGYLLRKEVCRAREDFEEIVKEIDGSLTHLKWVEAVISAPHFTDTDGPYLQPCSSVRKPSDPRRDVGAPALSPAPSSEQRGEHCFLLEKLEPEKDDLHSCLPSGCVREDGEGQRQSAVENKDRAVMESTGESSTTWSSPDLDMNCGLTHKGPQQYCLAQEVPRTPEALRLHRNTLTMELLWLQQAIDSRKKYLSLKDTLTLS